MLTLHPDTAIDLILREQREQMKRANQRARRPIRR
jgi:hypothetical protein